MSESALHRSPGWMTLNEVSKEDAITFPRASERGLFRIEPPPSRQLIYRYRMHGSISVSGQRVYLGWFREGAAVLTTVQAVERFVKAIYEDVPMKTADIDDRMVCEACESFACDGLELVDSRLMKLTGAPRKVVTAAMERAQNRGLIDCGVSLRTAWLTSKGKALLRNNGEDCRNEGQTSSNYF